MFHADSLDNFRRLTASNQHGFFHLSAAAERKKKRIAREDARAQSLVRSISDRTYFFASLRLGVKKQEFIFYPLPYLVVWRCFSKSIRLLACLACCLLRWQSCNGYLHKNG